MWYPSIIYFGNKWKVALKISCRCLTLPTSKSHIKQHRWIKHSLTQNRPASLFIKRFTQSFLWLIALVLTSPCAPSPRWHFWWINDQLWLGFFMWGRSPNELYRYIFQQEELADFRSPRAERSCWKFEHLKVVPSVPFYDTLCRNNTERIHRRYLMLWGLLVKKKKPNK